MALIAKQFRFEAAHHLRCHNGKCRNPHGHSYRVEARVTGTINPLDGTSSDEGMVLDFTVVSDILKPVIDGILDHHDLNDLLPVPTAERLACYIYGELVAGFVARGIPPERVSSIRVYETATSYAEVTFYDWADLGRPQFVPRLAPA